MDILAAALPPAAVRRNVLLASLSRWGIGGPARMVVEPGGRDALAATLRELTAQALPYVVIGDGSNLLFDDAGLEGVVVRIGRAFGACEIKPGGEVFAEAGLWVPTFVRRVIGAGLAGAVHAIGIPGTLGGLVTMNGGSQRRGIGEHIVAVTAMGPTGRTEQLDQAALAFAYRRSLLQQGGRIVVDATFRFEPGDRRALHADAVRILGDRRRKFPRIRANCGSVFVSDPALYKMIGPPGQAIEMAGLRGVAVGGAQFSPEHANFIVNTGGARSADVLELIGLARETVASLTGIRMDAEVRHVRTDGSIEAAHHSAEARRGAEVATHASAGQAPAGARQGTAG